MIPIPQGATENGKGDVHDRDGRLIEYVDGKWLVVVNGGRLGWWRYHEHYDRDGYCDNPARGY